MDDVLQGASFEIARFGAWIKDLGEGRFAVEWKRSGIESTIFSGTAEEVVAFTKGTAHIMDHMGEL